MKAYNSGRHKTWGKNEIKSLEILIKMRSFTNISYTKITRNLNDMYGKNRSVNSVEGKARRILKEKMN